LALDILEGSRYTAGTGRCLRTGMLMPGPALGRPDRFRMARQFLDS
jgi:hypothetical protein